MKASSAHYQLQESERLYAVIFDYAARIGSEPDPDNLLHLTADLARDLVRADRCSVWLHDVPAGELWTTVAHGTPTIRMGANRGLVGACISGNQNIVVNDTSKDPRFDGDVDRSSGYVTHSVLVLPLRSPAGDVLGALQLLNKPGGFEEEDIMLLGLAASYSASAIVTQRLRKDAEAARLLFRELEIARDVQFRLFSPTPPRIAGLDIAACCRPAELVGGDYYDFLYRPDSELWLTAGDVSGKGISAAILMANLQASLHNQLNVWPDSVADVVSELNQALFSTFRQERYTTLFCARFDPVERSLTYVNAGHVQPFLLNSSGQIRRLDCSGLPVGLFESAIYEPSNIRLHPGDLLACFSDGMTEATNPGGEIWDRSEVEKILRDYRHTSSGEILNKLLEAVDQYMGTAGQSDDITIVILRVL